MPFFIEWDTTFAPHPGAAPADHRVPLTGIARAEVGGDETGLDEWLGGREAPIRVLPDEEPGVRAVAIAGADGSEIVLRS
jgi:hypothetical protein